MGKWMPIDVTQCVFKEVTTFAVVIVVATVGATETVIRQQEGDLTSQVGVEQEVQHTTIDIHIPRNKCADCPMHADAIGHTNCSKKK